MPKLRDVIGHTTQLEALKSDIQNKNIAHAYLLAGSRHLGKMTIAHHFAYQLLSIKSPLEKPELLRQFERLLHPDLLVMDQLWIEDVADDWESISHTSNVPQVHRSKKPAAKTDTISIDDIRALQERLYETGAGEYRCCIIRSIERMQDTAANAFLKILEEPPEGLVFILTTQTPSALLPTILSRARIMHFNRLPRTELLPIVSALSEEDQKFILRIARGAPGVAKVLSKDPDMLRMHKTLHGQAHSFWRSQSVAERLQLLKPLHERGEDSDRFLLHLALALREQGTKMSTDALLSFHTLARQLRTNAHRELIAGNFALRDS